MGNFSIEQLSIISNSHAVISKERGVVILFIREAEREVELCSVAVVSSVVVMSSHIITNRMQFYFFQSKCVVIVSSACHFPTRGGMQSKSVKRSLRFPRSKFENFMGYP